MYLGCCRVLLFLSTRSYSVAAYKSYSYYLYYSGVRLSISDVEVVLGLHIENNQGGNVN